MTLPQYKTRKVTSADAQEIQALAVAAEMFSVEEAEFLGAMLKDDRIPRHDGVHRNSVQIVTVRAPKEFGYLEQAESHFPFDVGELPLFAPDC